MAELGLAGAPVPSITVTFLSTVDSAKAGALAASSATTAAPNFTTRMSKLPRTPYRTEVLYGTGHGKKTAKAVLLHCGIQTGKHQKERGRSFFRKSGAQYGLTPLYPVQNRARISVRARLVILRR